VGKLFIFGLTGNVLEGNFIGTDVTGTADPSESGSYGVLIQAGESVIGGTTPAARNLISGNTYGGVNIQSCFNIVQGNFIGTDVTGAGALPNGSGIGLSSTSGNLIGGTQAGAGNVISGNTGAGIAVTAAATQNNEIKGNFIGTDITGLIPLGNGTFGVSVFDSSYTVIGDDGPNVIA
jgi:titin